MLKTTYFGIEGHTENRAPFSAKRAKEIKCRKKSTLSHSADGTGGKAGELHLTCEEFDKFILHAAGTLGTI